MPEPDQGLFDRADGSQPANGVQEIAPGARLVRNWLTEAQQVQLLKVCKQVMEGPVPAHSPTAAFGKKMSVKMVCAGWHWQPYRYTRVAANVNGQRVMQLPELLRDLALDAVAATLGVDIARCFEPDVAIINSYDSHAKMGMHQDRDERCSAPVVSLSLGNSCVFRFGNPDTRNKPYRDIELRSGDLFVFGGPSRFAFHGVMRTHADTALSHLAISDERINVTIRQSGLS